VDRISLLVSKQFLVSDLEMWIALWLDRLGLPMEYLQLKLPKVMMVFIKGPSVIILWSVFYLEEGWWSSTQEERLMKYLGQLDRWPAQIHRLGLLASRCWMRRRRGCCLDLGYCMRWRRWCYFLSLWLGLSAFWDLSLRKSLTGLGASAPDDWVPLVIADAPVCCHKIQSFMS
jgi:hypothetical protein